MSAQNRKLNVFVQSSLNLIKSWVQDPLMKTLMWLENYILNSVNSSWPTVAQENALMPIRCKAILSTNTGSCHIETHASTFIDMADEKSFFWRMRVIVLLFICHSPDSKAHCCPACRTSLIATRFWVVVICPIIKCLTVLKFSFILFDLCLFITIFNLILNYVPIVTFWIFTYHKIWILLIIFCFVWNYWIIYFSTCLEVFWSVVS